MHLITDDVTLGLAVLPATGLLLGESGLGIMTVEKIGHQLDHFTSIALMLIAFGIGEHVELRRLDGMGRGVVYIFVLQEVSAFISCHDEYTDRDFAAVDDAIAIMIFGAAVSTAHNLASDQGLGTPVSGHSVLFL